MTTLSRRRFLQLAAGGFLGMGFASLGGAVYATSIEPFSIRQRDVNIALGKLPPAFEGYRLVHLSDIHLGYDVPADYIESVFMQVNALNPDAILVTGDYITRRYDTDIHDIERLFSLLSARDGVYAVLGNHDHWSQAGAVTQALTRASVQVLSNRHINITRGDDSLVIAGVDDVWEALADLDAALKGTADSACIVLMAHEPDYADAVAADGRVSLQLSGHTHGGQVRIPFFGAPVLPKFGLKYDYGVYHLRDLTLYTTSGVGMVKPAVRFNCPPEFVHITLTTA